MRAAPWAAAALLAFALAGCASLPGPVPARRPAAHARGERAPSRPNAPPPARVSCVPRTLAPKPRYPDTDAALKAAPGAADRYQLMAAGRLLRQKRLDELEQVVQACR